MLLMCSWEHIALVVHVYIFFTRVFVKYLFFNIYLMMWLVRVYAPRSIIYILPLMIQHLHKLPIRTREVLELEQASRIFKHRRKQRSRVKTSDHGDKEN